MSKDKNNNNIDKDKQLKDVIDYVEKELLKNQSIKEENTISNKVYDKINNKPQAKIPGLDHADATVDWGHGVTIEQLTPHCKGAISTMPEIIWKYCNIYKVNPALILAISSHETGYGTSNAIRNKNNPMGYMDPATKCKYLKEFSSLQEGYRTCISNVSRNYIAKGKNSIEAMARIYAPVGAANDPNGYNKNWPVGVNKIFKEITGKDYKPSMSGTGVKNEQLDPVIGGVNGGVTGDGSGEAVEIDFDNRESDDLIEVKGVILSFVTPYHLHKVKDYQDEWRTNENYNGWDRRFHYGIDHTGIKATGDDRKILESMIDNNTSTYINRALFKNKAINHCISIGAFVDPDIDYAETEKVLIRDVARVLHKYGLETKDLWREFDLNRAPSHLLYLERIDWKCFLQQIDNQLTVLYDKYPIDKKSSYEDYIGETGTIKNTCELLELPKKGAIIVQELTKGTKCKIKSYSNTWFEIDKPRGWIQVKDIEFEETAKSSRAIEEEEIESVGTSAKIKFPKIDKSVLPKITTVIDNDAFKNLLNYGDNTIIDNYAMQHEPYDKELDEIINAIVTDDERLDALTTVIQSSNENNIHYSVISASPGAGDHCKRASSELNAIWQSGHLKVEPVYPDLIIPPNFATTDQNLHDPNALPPGIFSDPSVIDDVNQEDLLEKLEDGSYKIKMFDYSKVSKEKNTNNRKPINYKEPYPYDDKIHELEAHYPKVKIDEIESRLYDCNHIGCPIGQPMAKNFHMLNDALIDQSKRTEARLVRLENILATMTRSIGRMASRININCVYYGGQDTFGKYKTIRCLKDDRGDDGCSMTLDQCLSCTRYEPILGQIYDILDSTGMNGAFITDDEQMSYGNAIDFNDITKVSSKKEFAAVDKDGESEDYVSLLKTWEESDKEKFIKELKSKYKGEELTEKIKQLKESDYLFKMDWNLSYLELQEPDVKRYPIEGIKAKYKVEETTETSYYDYLRTFALDNSLELEEAERILSRSIVTANAEFTAYYPANNSMQGGLYDAMGNKLDPSKLTCAAPKEIPFGTKIKVMGTGTDRDGKVYTVTDRGGAIKYNAATNTYKIDLLMSDKATCNKFGRRKGSIQIGGNLSINNNTNTGNIISSPSDSSGTITEGWNDLPYVDESQFGDNDVTQDNKNYDKISAGEWVDTREQADSFEILSYTSEEFYFDGFGTDVNSSSTSATDSSLTNTLGQSASDIRNKILEMANKIVQDCIDRKACYSNSPRTVRYDQPKRMTRNDLNPNEQVVAYDCSSFVSCCYFYAGLKELSIAAEWPTTTTQVAQIRKGGEMWRTTEEGAFDKAIPGDIILEGTGTGNNFVPNHVAIYMGDKKKAHASNRKNQSNGFKQEILISDATKSSHPVQYICRSKELIQLDNTKSEGSGQFTWPVPSSKRVTDTFGTPRSGGRKHSGIDVGAKVAGQLNKDEIVASDAGTVTYAGWSSGYGNLVKIDHGNGYETRYAHMHNNTIAVNKGDKVNKGQKVGMMGSTGNSSGSHLHFEIRKDGTTQDPLKFFNQSDYTIV